MQPILSHLQASRYRHCLPHVLVYTSWFSRSSLTKMSIIPGGSGRFVTLSNGWLESVTKRALSDLYN